MGQAETIRAGGKARKRRQPEWKGRCGHCGQEMRVPLKAKLQYTPEAQSIYQIWPAFLHNEATTLELYRGVDIDVLVEPDALLFCSTRCLVKGVKARVHLLKAKPEP